MAKITNNNQNMIERYVVAVTKRVPANQRKDIEVELRSLIEDELSQGENVSVEDVLLKLGNPNDLADNYLDHKRFIIGPALYDLYITIIKIVIPAVLLGITILLIIGYVANQDLTFWAFLGNLIGSWWSATLQAFAFITVGFAIAEHYNKGKEFEEKWHPDMLPELKAVQKNIKIGESITGIIVGVIALIVFNVSPEVIAIYSLSDGVQTAIIFNLTVLNSLLLFVNLSILLGIAKELAKILIGKYNWTLFVLNSILSIMVLVITIYVVKQPGLLNSNINTDLASMGMNLEINVLTIFEQVPAVVIILTIFVFVAESLTTFINTYKTRDSIFVITKK